MNALQPKIVTPKNRRRSPQIQKKRAKQNLAREISLKIFANTVLSSLSIFGLSRLIPYQLEQYENLSKINKQTQTEEAKVEQLRQAFSRSFDPTQSKKILQELTNQADPNQRIILFSNSPN